MKWKSTLLWFAFAIILPAMKLQGQYAVGFPDTIVLAKLDVTITINVVQNDSAGADGEKPWISWAYNVVSFTDSTLTLHIPYEDMYSINGVERLAAYRLGNGHPGEYTRVYARYHNPFYDWLDINGVKAIINSLGSHFWDMNYYSSSLEGVQGSEPGYEVPAGSGLTSAFAHSIWIGGFDASDTLHFSQPRYQNWELEIFPGPISDPLYYDNVYDSAWSRLWKIDRLQIEDHINNWWKSTYTIPEVILSWPGNGDTLKGQAWQLAPFHDRNNNGKYEPSKGDYPMIRGDQTLFFILNDKRRTIREPGMGVEIHAWAYAFDCPSDTALWYTTFFHYEIINRSNETYSDCYIGLFGDLELGYAWDDFNASDVIRNSLYAYNGTSVDGAGDTSGNGYGAYPPAISMTLLAGAYLDPDGLDNPDEDGFGNRICGPNINGRHFGDGIPDNERYGMSYSFQQEAGYWVPTEPPYPNSIQNFNLLKGVWPDGASAFKYGGNGRPETGSTDQDCRYLFPGLSDPCNYGTFGNQPPGYITGAGGNGIVWTEESAGNQPYDRYGITSSGPFTFLPGDKQEVDLAFVWARQFNDTAAQAVIPLLKQRIDQIIGYYLSDSTPCGASFSFLPDEPEETELTVFPNPSTDRISLRYPATKAAPVYQLFSITGGLVSSSTLSISGADELSLQSFPAGMYLLRFIAGTQSTTVRIVRY